MVDVSIDPSQPEFHCHSSPQLLPYASANKQCVAASDASDNVFLKQIDNLPDPRGLVYSIFERLLSIPYL